MFTPEVCRALGYTVTPNGTVFDLKLNGAPQSNPATEAEGWTRAAEHLSQRYREARALVAAVDAVAETGRTTITLRDFTSDQVKAMDLSTAQAELSNAVYRVTDLMERLENAGKVHGNGHHMRQAVAAGAEKLLAERWRPEEEPTA